MNHRVRPKIVFDMVVGGSEVTGGVVFNVEHPPKQIHHFATYLLS